MPDTTGTIEDGTLAIEGLLTDADTEPQVTQDESQDTEGGEAETETQESKGEDKTDGKPNEAPQEIELDEDATELELEHRIEDGSFVKEKVSLSELKKGYMRQKDYSFKTGEVARQREAVQEEVQKAIAPKLQELEQSLAMAKQVIVEVVGPELQGIDWMSLATQDPAKYVELRAKADAAAGKVQAINAKMQQIQTARAQEYQQQQAKAIRVAQEQLSKDIPDWGEAKYKSLLKSGVEHYGFKPEEIGNVVDARVIKMLHDASEWRALQAAKPIVGKKVVKVPKVVKPGAPQTKADRDDAQLKEAQERLRKSGKDLDAAKLIEQLI